MPARLNRAFSVNTNERQVSLNRNDARRAEEHRRLQWFEKKRLRRQTMKRFGGAELKETAAFICLCRTAGVRRFLPTYDR